MSMKNPVTPAGIEPATFRFVAQHLNHIVLSTENNEEIGNKTQCLKRNFHFELGNLNTS